jgi:hypothetical protein
LRIKRLEWKLIIAGDSKVQAHLERSSRTSSIVAYLYGFGGCVWERGDNSGDEDEDEAMMKRERRRIREERRRTALRLQWGEAAQYSLGLSVSTKRESQQTFVIRRFPSISKAQIQKTVSTATRYVNGIPFAWRTPAPPPASTHQVQTS